ncbi:MAG: hypothetical protein LAT80_14785 [Balneolaceae bacterium]|nr:hypothetical protein [Saccharospirillum sp.]MCH8550135.1 hypothetical protein [Balneolaceae bacterium]
MKLKEDNLTRQFQNIPYALSAHRLWEHTQYRQISPFQPITIHSYKNPEAYVDVVNLTETWPIYLGVNLQEALKNPNQLLSSESLSMILDSLKTADITNWLHLIGDHLNNTSKRQAVRNPPSPFLSSGKAYPLSIYGLNGALRDWFVEHNKDKSAPVQWLNRIQNLTRKGLKLEEFDITGVKIILDKYDHKGTITGKAISNQLQYKELIISVIPVVKSAKTHLNWIPAPPTEYIKRIKPKINNRNTSTPQWRDPVMGYWIDRIDWDDLLGTKHCWMAFNHRGKSVTSKNNPTGLYGTPEEARYEANRDAGKLLPRLSSKGDWASYRLTGGENYREWLITLPYFLPTFFSDHFAHRNVLIHIRSDVREGREGEKVLFLQEIQSDWAQQARRQLKYNAKTDTDIPLPPWLHEWPALALKLMLLHAAEQSFDALAWTTGKEQIERYGGLGEDGLLELYDRTLPKEADRITKPLSAKRCSIDIFVPANFSIEPTDDGYEVFDHNDNSLGTTATWQQAQKLLPSGAHELLHSMHGIQLGREVRLAILERGFYAWGTGIRKN